MERMMHMEQYSSNNSKYTTQLLDNFRSHDAILKFSNDHFYNEKLRAKVPKEIADFAINWNFLPNKRFPIILHASLSSCEKTIGDTSWSNMDEVNMVKTYVNTLLMKGINGKKVKQKDIGVISFYKAQLDILKKAFSAILFMEIGTAEYYQGREKKIIIITTVKSNSCIGFLNEEKVSRFRQFRFKICCSIIIIELNYNMYILKRINVAMTRARSLMILVCNPKTLQKDQMWYDFIKYCYDNKACVGEQFRMNMKSPQQIARQNYERKQASERERLRLEAFLFRERISQYLQIENTYACNWNMIMRKL